MNLLGTATGMRRCWRAVVTVMCGLSLVACGASPGRIGPRGIDELEIPTPHPRAADFSDRIDNPYLPLAAGSVWVYESTGSQSGRTITVTVLSDRKLIQGISTNVVREVVRDETGEIVRSTDEWFAQDRRGNVWKFGSTAADGPWQAGVGSAEAGLAMAAVPRVGDGYLLGRLAGVSQDQASVLAVEGKTTVPFGDVKDVVVILMSSPLSPGHSQQLSYARGVGLVRSVSESQEGMELVSWVAG